MGQPAAVCAHSTAAGLSGYAGSSPLKSHVGSGVERALRVFLRHGVADRLARRVFIKALPITPPVIADGARYLLSEWERQPGEWVDDPGIKGWNDQSVADVQVRHWPILYRNVQGPGPLGVSHFPTNRSREDWGDHNTVMSYGYVLARASRTRDWLAILDWGGGLGHYYLYSRALLPDVALEYHCYDVPALCTAGRKLLPEVQFHEDVEGALGRQYDLVISSSSLHYCRNWQAVLRRLAAVTSGFLYVARLQTVLHEPSFVAIQRPHQFGYFTEYLSWLINREEFLDYVASAGLELVREFVFAERWPVRGSREQGGSRGFLLRHRGP